MSIVCQVKKKFFAHFSRHVGEQRRISLCQQLLIVKSYESFGPFYSFFIFSLLCPADKTRSSNDKCETIWLSLCPADSPFLLLYILVTKMYFYRSYMTIPSPWGINRTFNVNATLIYAKTDISPVAPRDSLSPTAIDSRSRNRSVRNQRNILPSIPRGFEARRRCVASQAWQRARMGDPLGTVWRLSARRRRNTVNYVDRVCCCIPPDPTLSIPRRRTDKENAYPCLVRGSDGEGEEGIAPSFLALLALRVGVSSETRGICLCRGAESRSRRNFVPADLSTVYLGKSGF